MKKRVVLLFSGIIFGIYLISFISATYNCSDGSQFVEETREIDVLERKTINELGIAIVNADEVPAMAKIMSEFIIDAQEVSLTNETPELEVEFLDKTYLVKLVNATNNAASIKLGKYSKSVVKREVTAVGNFDVLIINSEGPDPKNVDLFIGVDRVTLTNKGNPTQIVTVNNTKYMLELSSASDIDATITVRKCLTGDIQEFEEVVLNVTGDNDASDANGADNEANPTTENENASGNETEPECAIIGSRKNNTYCNNNQLLAPQKELGSGCDEDYECITDNCESKECSEKRVWQRILDWFKGLFRD